MRMISSRNIGKRLRNVILYMGVPVAAAYLVDTLGAPWYVFVFTLILAPYWYGPVLVYYRARMPMISSLQAIVDRGERPPAHG